MFFLFCFTWGLFSVKPAGIQKLYKTFYLENEKQNMCKSPKKSTQWFKKKCLSMKRTIKEKKKKLIPIWKKQQMHATGKVNQRWEMMPIENFGQRLWKNYGHEIRFKHANKI